LRANNIDTSEVEVRNSSTSVAADSFISGEAPAVALWVPFNITVREERISFALTAPARRRQDRKKCIAA
jgi:hypothetical protein